ncbi:MAG: type II secretion system F family protein [Candidatus Nanohaloarchaea archaeon]|nr:type II secretion system F family protein [Candidatus Nanohaloarchaea archaeon]
MEWLDNLTTTQKVEYGSFGAGGLLLVIAVAVYISVSKSIGGALFLAGLIGSFTPYGIYVYFKNKKYREIEREFPGFLRNLSESRKSGMSLPEAFKNAAKTDYGRLNNSVEKAAKQLSWDIPFPEVMKRFQDRLRESDLIRRSISIIMQSYESGGDVSETLDSVARNISSIKEAEKERQAVLQQQVYIIYAIFFLFIGILIALFKVMAPLLNIGGGGFIGTPPNFCISGSFAEPICSLCPALGLSQDPTSKLCYYKSMFLLMILVQGTFNGLVAGEIGSGKVAAGFKHAMLMVPLGTIIYIGLMTLLG